MTASGTILLVASLLCAGGLLAWLGYSLRYRRRLSLLIAYRRGRLTDEAASDLARFVGAWTVAFGVVVAALAAVALYAGPSAVTVPLVVISSIYAAIVLVRERRLVD